MNDTLKCKIRTVLVEEGDTIESISASLLEKTLHIKVVTQPYSDLYWEDIYQLVNVHDIYFNIIGFKKGTYNLIMDLNNVILSRDDVLID